MPNVTIRVAVADDVAGLTRVMTAAYAPYKAAGLRLPPVTDGLSQDIRDHDTIVAVMDDQIVGGLVLMAGDPPKIANLAVSPDAAGQGIGRKLMDAAISSVGRGTLTLTTHEDMVDTQEFYGRLGWVETGRDGDRVFMTLHI